MVAHVVTPWKYLEYLQVFTPLKLSVYIGAGARSYKNVFLRLSASVEQLLHQSESVKLPEVNIPSSILLLNLSKAPAYCKMSVLSFTKTLTLQT